MFPVTTTYMADSNGDQMRVSSRSETSILSTADCNVSDVGYLSSSDTILSDTTRQHSYVMLSPRNKTRICYVPDVHDILTPLKTLLPQTTFDKDISSESQKQTESKNKKPDPVRENNICKHFKMIPATQISFQLEENNVWRSSALKFSDKPGKSVVGLNQTYNDLGINLKSHVCLQDNSSNEAKVVERFKPYPHFPCYTTSPSKRGKLVFGGPRKCKSDLSFFCKDRNDSHYGNSGDGVTDSNVIVSNDSKQQDTGSPKHHCEQKKSNQKDRLSRITTHEQEMSRIVSQRKTAPLAVKKNEVKVPETFNVQYRPPSKLTNFKKSQNPTSTFLVKKAVLKCITDSRSIENKGSHPAVIKTSEKDRCSRRLSRLMDTGSARSGVCSLAGQRITDQTRRYYRVSGSSDPKSDERKKEVTGAKGTTDSGKMCNNSEYAACSSDKKFKLDKKPIISKPVENANVKLQCRSNDCRPRDSKYHSKCYNDIYKATFMENFRNRELKNVKKSECEKKETVSTPTIPLVCCPKEVPNSGCCHGHSSLTTCDNNCKKLSSDIMDVTIERSTTINETCRSNDGDSEECITNEQQENEIPLTDKVSGEKCNLYSSNNDTQLCPDYCNEYLDSTKVDHLNESYTATEDNNQESLETYTTQVKAETKSSLHFKAEETPCTELQNEAKSKIETKNQSSQEKPTVKQSFQSFIQSQLASDHVEEGGSSDNLGVQLGTKLNVIVRSVLSFLRQKDSDIQSSDQKTHEIPFYLQNCKPGRFNSGLLSNSPKTLTELSFEQSGSTTQSISSLEIESSPPLAQNVLSNKIGSCFSPTKDSSQLGLNYLEAIKESSTKSYLRDSYDHPVDKPPQRDEPRVVSRTSDFFAACNESKESDKKDSHKNIFVSRQKGNTKVNVEHRVKDNTNNPVMVHNKHKDETIVKATAQSQQDSINTQANLLSKKSTENVRSIDLNRPINVINFTEDQTVDEVKAKRNNTMTGSLEQCEAMGRANALSDNKQTNAGSFSMQYTRLKDIKRRFGRQGSEVLMTGSDTSLAVLSKVSQPSTIRRYQPGRFTVSTGHNELEINREKEKISCRCAAIHSILTDLKHHILLDRISQQRYGSTSQYLPSYDFDDERKLSSELPISTKPLDYWSSVDKPSKCMDHSATSIILSKECPLPKSKLSNSMLNVDQSEPSASNVSDSVQLIASIIKENAISPREVLKALGYEENQIIIAKKDSFKKKNKNDRRSFIENYCRQLIEDWQRKHAEEKYNEDETKTVDRVSEGKDDQPFMNFLNKSRQYDNQVFNQRLAIPSVIKNEKTKMSDKQGDDRVDCHEMERFNKLKDTCATRSNKPVESKDFIHLVHRFQNMSTRELLEFALCNRSNDDINKLVVREVYKRASRKRTGMKDKFQLRQGAVQLFFLLSKRSISSQSESLENLLCPETRSRKNSFFGRNKSLDLRGETKCAAADSYSILKEEFKERVKENQRIINQWSFSSLKKYRAGESMHNDGVSKVKASQLYKPTQYPDMALQEKKRCCEENVLNLKRNPMKKIMFSSTSSKLDESSAQEIGRYNQHRIRTPTESMLNKMNTGPAAKFTSPVIKLSNKKCVNTDGVAVCYLRTSDRKEVKIFDPKLTDDSGKDTENSTTTSMRETENHSSKIGWQKNTGLISGTVSLGEPRDKPKGILKTNNLEERVALALQKSNTREPPLCIGHSVVRPIASKHCAIQTNQDTFVLPGTHYILVSNDSHLALSRKTLDCAVGQDDVKIFVDASANTDSWDVETSEDISRIGYNKKVALDVNKAYSKSSPLNFDETNEMTKVRIYNSNPGQKTVRGDCPPLLGGMNEDTTNIGKEFKPFSNSQTMKTMVDAEACETKIKEELNDSVEMKDSDDLHKKFKSSKESLNDSGEMKDSDDLHKKFTSSKESLKSPEITDDKLAGTKQGDVTKVIGSSREMFQKVIKDLQIFQKHNLDDCNVLMEQSSERTTASMEEMDITKYFITGLDERNKESIVEDSLASSFSIDNKGMDTSVADNFYNPLHITEENGACNRLLRTKLESKPANSSDKTVDIEFSSQSTERLPHLNPKSKVSGDDTLCEESTGSVNKRDTVIVIEEVPEERIDLSDRSYIGYTVLNTPQTKDLCLFISDGSSVTIDTQETNRNDVLYGAQSLGFVPNFKQSKDPGEEIQEHAELSLMELCPSTYIQEPLMPRCASGGSYVDATGAYTFNRDVSRTAKIEYPYQSEDHELTSSRVEQNGKSTNPFRMVAGKQNRTDRYKHIQHVSPIVHIVQSNKTDQDHDITHPMESFNIHGQQVLRVNPIHVSRMDPVSVTNIPLATTMPMSPWELSNELSNQANTDNVYSKQAKMADVYSNQIILDRQRNQERLMENRCMPNNRQLSMQSTLILHNQTNTSDIGSLQGNELNLLKSGFSTRVKSGETVNIALHSDETNMLDGSNQEIRSESRCIPRNIIATAGTIASDLESHQYFRYSENETSHLDCVVGGFDNPLDNVYYNRTHPTNSDTIQVGSVNVPRNQTKPFNCTHLPSIGTVQNNTDSTMRCYNNQIGQTNNSIEQLNHQSWDTFKVTLPIRQAATTQYNHEDLSVEHGIGQIKEGVDGYTTEPNLTHFNAIVLNQADRSKLTNSYTKNMMNTPQNFPKAIFVRKVSDLANSTEVTSYVSPILKSNQIIQSNQVHQSNHVLQSNPANHGHEWTNPVCYYVLPNSKSEVPSTLSLTDTLNQTGSLTTFYSVSTEICTKSEPILQIHRERLFEPTHKQNTEPFSEPIPWQHTKHFSEPISQQNTEPFSESIHQQHTEPFSEPNHELHTEPFSESVHQQWEQTFSEPIHQQHTESFSETIQHQNTESFSEPIYTQHSEPFPEPIHIQHSEPLSEPIHIQYKEKNFESIHQQRKEPFSEPIYAQHGERFSDYLYIKLDNQVDDKENPANSHCIDTFIQPLIGPLIVIKQLDGHQSPMSENECADLIHSGQLKKVYSYDKYDFYAKEDDMVDQQCTPIKAPPDLLRSHTHMNTDHGQKLIALKYSSEENKQAITFESISQRRSLSEHSLWNRPSRDSLVFESLDLAMLNSSVFGTGNTANLENKEAPPDSIGPICHIGVQFTKQSLYTGGVHGSKIVEANDEHVKSSPPIAALDTMVSGERDTVTSLPNPRDLKHTFIDIGQCDSDLSIGISSVKHKASEVTSNYQKYFSLNSPTASSSPSCQQGSLQSESREIPTASKISEERVELQSFSKVSDQKKIFMQSHSPRQVEPDFKSSSSSKVKSISINSMETCLPVRSNSSKNTILTESSPQKIKHGSWSQAMVGDKGLSKPQATKSGMATNDIDHESRLKHTLSSFQKIYVTGNQTKENQSASPKCTRLEPQTNSLQPPKSNIKQRSLSLPFELTAKNCNVISEKSPEAIIVTTNCRPCKIKSLTCKKKKSEIVSVKPTNKGGASDTMAINEKRCTTVLPVETDKMDEEEKKLYSRIALTNDQEEVSCENYTKKEMSEKCEKTPTLLVPSYQNSKTPSPISLSSSLSSGPKQGCTSGKLCHSNLFVIHQEPRLLSYSNVGCLNGISESSSELTIKSTCGINGEDSSSADELDSAEEALEVEKATAKRSGSCSLSDSYHSCNSAIQ